MIPIMAISAVKNTMSVTDSESQGKIVRKHMWPSSEIAICLYKAANISLIVALGIGVIATGLVVWMGSVKEGYLRRDLAELEKEAANARLETERLKEAVSWRVIPPECASELEKVLSAKPGSVNLRYMDGDPEALYLAIQYSRILSKANWKVAEGAVKPHSTIMFGIGLPDGSGVDANTLRDAFLAAKVPFSTNALPPAGITFSISTIPGAPTLIIGSKEPALP